jgi:hypothetical protein
MYPALPFYEIMLTFEVLKGITTEEDVIALDTG